MAAKVANAYLAALRDAKRRAVPVANEISELLDAAKTAMDGGAWKGGKADDFYNEIIGHRKSLRRIETDALKDLADKIGVEDNEPQVEPTDRRAHWPPRGGA